MRVGFLADHADFADFADDGAALLGRQRTGPAGGTVGPVCWDVVIGKGVSILGRWAGHLRRRFAGGHGSPLVLMGGAHPGGIRASIRA
jgi:hypothetical protein